MTEISTPSDLSSVISDMTQMNFEIALALKQQRIRFDRQKEEFIEEFQEFRDSAEERIDELEKSYSSSLINVIKSRSFISNRKVEQKMISEEELTIQLETLKTLCEKELREEQEGFLEENMQLTSERDILAVENEELKTKIRALNEEMESVQQPLILEEQQPVLPEIESSFKINSSTNTIEEADVELKITEVRLKPIKISEDEQVPIISLPWILASETSQRILSDKHAKLLQTLMQRDSLISFLTHEVRENDLSKAHLIGKETEYQEEIATLKQQNELLQVMADNQEATSKQEIVQLEQQAQQYKQELETEQLTITREEVKLELYEEELRTAKQLSYQQFKQHERIEDNEKLGSLQNELIYLSNFEKIYAKTLADITKRNISLEQSNEELRMYNVSFNARLNEVTEKAQKAAELLFIEQISACEKEENSRLREISTLRNELQEKCNEIQQISHFESILKQNLENSRAQNIELLNIQQEERTDYENLHAQYKTVKRLFCNCIEQKQDVKKRGNEILNKVDELIDYEVQSKTEDSIVINALKVKLAELYIQLYKQDPYEFVKETILNSCQVPVNEQLSGIQLGKIQYNPALLSKNQEFDMKLYDYEERALNDECEVLTIVLECDSCQTDDVPSIRETSQSVVINSNMIDASEQVNFHTDQSDLLKEAYKEINSLNLELSDYNSLMKRFSNIKQKIFEECYYEDIEMMRQCRENTRLSQEDLDAEIFRYAKLVDHWSHHQCPTFETFKPIVDKMIDQITMVKDAEISKVRQENQFLTIENTQKQNEKDYLANKYEYLQNYILSTTYDFAKAEAENSLLSSKQKTIFQKLGMLLEKVKTASQRAEENSSELASIELIRKTAEAKQTETNIVFEGSNTDLLQEKKRTKRHDTHSRSIQQTSMNKSSVSILAKNSDSNIINNLSINSDVKRNSSESNVNEYKIIKSVSDISSFEDSKERKLQNTRHSTEAQSSYSLNKNYEDLIGHETKEEMDTEAMQEDVEYHQQSTEYSNDDAKRTTEEGVQSLVAEQQESSEQSGSEESNGSSSYTLVSEEAQFSEQWGQRVEMADKGCQIDILHEDLFYSCYLEQFNLLKEEVNSRRLKCQDLLQQQEGLAQQLEKKETHIATLLHQLDQKQREMDYNFVHRPSREEDLALIASQEEQLAQFRKWYLSSLQDNQRLLDQLNRNEEEIQTFFGTQRFRVDPESQKNEMAAFTKEQLIKLRQQGQTKIDRLFATGSAEMKSVNLANQRSIIGAKVLDDFRLNMKHAQFMRKLPQQGSGNARCNAEDEDNTSTRTEPPQSARSNEQSTQQLTIASLQENSIYTDADIMTHVDQMIMTSRAEEGNKLEDLEFSSNQTKKTTNSIQSSQLPPKPPEFLSKRAPAGRKNEEFSRLQRENQKLTKELKEKITSERSKSNIENSFQRKKYERSKSERSNEQKYKQQRYSEGHTILNLSPEGITQEYQLEYFEDRFLNESKMQDFIHKRKSEEVQRENDDTIVPELQSSKNENPKNRPAKGQIPLQSKENWSTGVVGEGSPSLSRSGTIKLAKRLPGSHEE